MFSKIIFTLTLLFTTSSLFANISKPTLIFYCGITMVKPIKEMAKIIEDKYDCIIKISQGGSKDLYESLKYSKIGDLYLPGSSNYRINNLKDGFLLEMVEIGYNKAAIFVHKSNPLEISSLDDFINPKLSIILSDPDSGSIGKMTKKIFLDFEDEDYFNKVYDNTIEIGTDSRNINKALIKGRAQLSINWKATASWPENKPFLSIVEIDEKYAKKQKLQISLLKFSKNKKIARAFMELASSKQGQTIMKKYGFL